MYPRIFSIGLDHGRLVALRKSCILGMLNGNVENKWATFQDGTGKAAFSPFCRAHVRHVRSARQTMVVPFGIQQAMRGLSFD
jgi:hypothetical protein